MKFRFSISLKLLVLILPLVCLPIALVGYFSFQASVDRVDRLVRHEQMVQVKATASEINEIFYYCRLDLETIASLPVLEDYHHARAFRLSAEAEFNHDNISRLFNDFINRTPYYHQIRYIDHQGQELIKVNRNGAVTDLRNRHTEAFFQQTRNLGKNDIRKSDIIRSAADSGLVIHWTKPIFSALREFTGVVVIDMDYQKIIQMVQQIKIEERGYAFLIDEAGRLIAHPRFEPFSLHLGNYPDRSLIKMIREMMTGVSEWRSYTFEGEEKVAAFAPIPIMKWSLAVTIPRVDFRKEALAIRTRVIQAVGLTLLFAVAGVTLLAYRQSNASGFVRGSIVTKHTRRKRDITTFGKGIHCIDNDVYDNLFKLMRVNRKKRQIGRQPVVKQDVTLPGPFFKKLLSGQDQLIDIR